MAEDPIVEEVRQVRQQHAAKFNFDLQAIVQDLQQQEARSGWQVVAFPPRNDDLSVQPAKQSNTC